MSPTETGTEIDEVLQDATEQLCTRCDGEIQIVANGSRPEVDLTCDCGVVAVLC